MVSDLSSVRQKVKQEPQLSQEAPVVEAEKGTESKPLIVPKPEPSQPTAKVKPKPSPVSAKEKQPQTNKILKE